MEKDNTLAKKLEYTDSRPLNYKPFSSAFIAILKKKEEEEKQKTEKAKIKIEDNSNDNSSNTTTAASKTPLSALDVKKPNISASPDIRAKVMKIQAVKKSVVEYTNEIGPAMQDWVKALIYGYNLDDEEARAGCQEEIAAIEKRILENLYPKDDNDQLAMHYAGPARWAYANAVIACAQNKNDILAAIYGNKNYPGLPGLMPLEMLEFAKNSPNNPNAITVEVYGRWYRINLAPEQASHLKVAIIEALKRAGMADKTYQEYAIKPLADAADISIQEIEQKDGTSFWIVPPGKREDKKTGKPYKLSGGFLLMESNTKVLKILGVAGDFQLIMEEIRDAGIFLPIRTIPIPTEEVRFPDNLLADVVRYLVILHSALHRGWELYQREQKRETMIKKFKTDCDAERDEVFKQRATASMADWMIERKAGTVMLYWGRKPWVVKKAGDEEYYYEVYSLWERNAEEEIKCVWYPERLKQLFKKAPVDFVDPGERYEKLCSPYNAMMKSAYAHAKVQEQEEKEHEATRKWLEDQKAATTPGTTS